MNKRRREEVHDEYNDEEIQGTHRNAGKKIVGENKFKKVGNRPFNSKSSDNRSFPKKNFDNKSYSQKKFEKPYGKDNKENDKEDSQSKKLRHLYNDLMKKTENEAKLKKKESTVDQILNMIQGVITKVYLLHFFYFLDYS